MIDILQQILFSDFVIIGLIGVVIILITVWAQRLSEWAGYILGWLVGIFLILVLITLLPVAPPTDPTLAPVPARLTFFELIIPSFFGLLFGFGLLFVLRIGGYSDSRIRRAFTVAALMSFTLVSGYLLLRSSIQDRTGLAVFVLTFAIGALLNFILTRGMSARNPLSGTL